MNPPFTPTPGFAPYIEILPLCDCAECMTKRHRTRVPFTHDAALWRKLQRRNP